MILHAPISEGVTHKSLKNVAIVSNYVPIQCGISTFAKNLHDAMAAQLNIGSVKVICIDDGQCEEPFPPEVAFVAAKNKRADYRAAAEFVNRQNFDVVCIQHEYGIFGGDAGDYLLDFVERLTKPYIITLHTVLREPNPDQRQTLLSLTSSAEQVVVMSDKAREILIKIYNIPSDRIVKIHHGVPDEFVRPGFTKRNPKQTTLLTFGLLSPDKGIENVIHALPEIVQECPDVKYVVVGATHPHIRVAHGEVYRESLMRLAEDLGVEKHVQFDNHFLTPEELVEYFRIADIYITPYLKEEQVTSGTLAYAVGCGKVVVSTPYWYAQELLAGERGFLVPFRDSDKVAETIISVLTDSDLREKVQANASQLGVTMSWNAVGGEYTHLANMLDDIEILRELHPSSKETIPDISLAHLRTLTDGTGILQHARYCVPRYEEGYCVDDNARALLVTGLIQSGSNLPPLDIDELSGKYLAFMAYALNTDGNRFRNFMSYSGEWLEEAGSEDSQGRSLWGLASFAVRTQNRSQSMCALEVFREAFPSSRDWTSPRAWAYTLLAIGELFDAGQCPSSLVLETKTLAAKLINIRNHASNDKWKWFECSATYCNARLPQALIKAGEILEDSKLTEAGLESLEWLWNEQLDSEGFFEPLGCDGLHLQDGERHRFDQQPVEACATVSACLTAWQATGKGVWKDRAWQAFRWFLGENCLGVRVYDSQTGAGYDGITRNGLNQNQGAESTLSFLMACLEMKTLSTAKSIAFLPVKITR